MNIAFIIIIEILSILVILYFRFILSGGNYGLIARNIIRSYNVFRRYYKKGVDLDVSVSLELSVIFSQILYIKRKEIDINFIREIAKDCVHNNSEEFIALSAFVKRMMIIILSIDTKVSEISIAEKVYKKGNLIDNIILVNLGSFTGNKMLYKKTIKFIEKNPRCWDGIYDELESI